MDPTHHEHPPTPKPLLPPSARLSVADALERHRRLEAQGQSHLPDVVIEADILNIKLVERSGIRYIKLIDGGARIEAVIFRKHAHIVPQGLREGMRIRVTGSVLRHQSEQQIEVTSLQTADEAEAEPAPAVRRDPHKLNLAELIRRGVLERRAHRPVPRRPRCIAVVASCESVALQDVLGVLWRDAPDTDALVAPVAVQGPGASERIARAIALVASAPDVEVVVLTRGGGTAHDLAVFDDDAVVRAILAPTPQPGRLGRARRAESPRTTTTATPNGNRRFAPEKTMGTGRGIDPLPLHVQTGEIAMRSTTTQPRRPSGAFAPLMSAPQTSRLGQLVQSQRVSVGHRINVRSQLKAVRENRRYVSRQEASRELTRLLRIVNR